MRGALRLLRVPEECPQEVADLFEECTRPDPAGRPTAGDLVRRLTALGSPPPPHGVGMAGVLPVTLS